jgi:hypothetical protein
MTLSGPVWIVYSIDAAPFLSFCGGGWLLRVKSPRSRIRSAQVMFPTRTTIGFFRLLRETPTCRPFASLPKVSAPPTA